VSFPYLLFSIYFYGMTLGDCFDYVGNNPSWILFYFIAVPFLAFITWQIAKDEGDTPPWTYLYTLLVYLVAIPGIFAITLNVYLFLFERQPIFDTNLYTQILPIASMGLSLYLIRKNVCFEDIPGFGKLSGLIMILTALIAVMWFLEKTFIVAFTSFPIHYLLVGFVFLLVIVRFGWSRIFG